MYISPKRSISNYNANAQAHQGWLIGPGLADTPRHRNTGGQEGEESWLPGFQGPHPRPPEQELWQSDTLPL